MDSGKTPRTGTISWRNSAGPLAVAFCLFVFAAAMSDSGSLEKPVGHESLVCSGCHVLTASIESNYYPAVDLNAQCRGCHTSLSSGPGELALGFHAAASADCVRCHSFHETSRVSLNDVDLQFDFSNSSRTAQCSTCHGAGVQTSGLSSGHQAAAELYHSDRFRGLSASQSCLVCHSESAASLTGLLGKAVLNAPRFSEHGSHPVGVPVVPGSGQPGNKIRRDLDSRIKLFNGNVECQSCHSLTAKTKTRLVKFDGRNDLCLGCHQPS